jgi:hypothetical protein
LTAEVDILGVIFWVNFLFFWKVLFWEARIWAVIKDRWGNTWCWWHLLTIYMAIGFVWDAEFNPRIRHYNFWSGWRKYRRFIVSVACQILELWHLKLEVRDVRVNFFTVFF